MNTNSLRGAPAHAMARIGFRAAEIPRAAQTSPSRHGRTLRAAAKEAVGAKAATVPPTAVGPCVSAGCELCIGGEASRGVFSARRSHRRYYMVLHGVCGPCAPLRLLALALLLAPPASHTAAAKLWRTWTRIGTLPPKCQELLRLPAAMAANCEPAFGLLRHRVQGKCGVSILELYAADIAVLI